MTEDRKPMTEREAKAIVKAKYPDAVCAETWRRFWAIFDGRSLTAPSIGPACVEKSEAWKAAAESLREGSKS